jgi:hypothetical protein
MQKDPMLLSSMEMAAGLVLLLLSPLDVHRSCLNLVMPLCYCFVVRDHAVLAFSPIQLQCDTEDALLK